jgi:hypothetical protein
MGWSGHPIFGQGVAGATLYGRYGVAEATLRAFGVVRPPKKAKKKKKKKRKKKIMNGFGLLGVVKGLGVAP